MHETNEIGFIPEPDMHEALHLYAQPSWHEEAWICGEREALQRLHEALGRALSSGTPQQMPAMSGDGEGYTLHIVIADAEQMQTIATPYTDEVASDSRTAGPWDLVDKPATRST